MDDRRMRTMAGMSTLGRAARVVAALALIMLAAVPPLRGAPLLLQESAITVGMTGIGKTVVLGTQITEFRVTVLGILKNAGPAGDLVLFRASGPAVESAGGLAAGMSGSPIYLGGRLAGAFSYSFQSADPTVGLFTPIGDMLRDLPPARTGTTSAAPPYPVPPMRIGGRLIRRIIVTRRDETVFLRRSDTLVAVPAETPLFVSGIGVPQEDALAKILDPMGIVPMRGAGPADLPANLPLVPGSAIGVGLMQGEISAYAIGTLTYRDGNTILAFGHPFTDTGRASYLLSNATIFQTIRGQERNVKIGAAGQVVGTISEDRPAAIGGTIGVLPRVFGVRVRVSDADDGRSREFHFQVITNKTLAPILVQLGAQGAIQRVLNRSGEGTAQVQITLRAQALPHPIVRNNLFYSGNDIAAQALSEVPQALHLMFDNDFTDVGPSDITINVQVTGQQATAAITDVDTPQTSVAPGGTVHVRVQVRPFRGTPRAEDISIVIPLDFPSGTALLTVRAGGSKALVPLPAVGQIAAQTPDAVRTLTDAITAFEQAEKNTDVVVELTGAQRTTSGTAGPSGAAKVSAVTTTPWVLHGHVQIPIMVEGVSH
jgi:SpoIVB peptidase S55